jgi:hypothetical protein
MLSIFSTMTKVGYVNNNLAELFNNWVGEYKMPALVEFLEKLRYMIIQLREKRGLVVEG